MRFTVITALALFSASALAEPIPMADSLGKRADNWCKVIEPGGVNCRKKPTTNSDTVKVEGNAKIPVNKKFGVLCTKEGESIFGDKTWDYIPGWGCWVSAYYTRSAGTQRYCETGLSTCP